MVTEKRFECQMRMVVPHFRHFCSQSNMPRLGGRLRGAKVKLRSLPQNPIMHRAIAHFLPLTEVLLQLLQFFKPICQMFQVLVRAVRLEEENPLTWLSI